MYVCVQWNIIFFDMWWYFVADGCTCGRLKDSLATLSKQRSKVLLIENYLIIFLNPQIVCWGKVCCWDVCWMRKLVLQRHKWWFFVGDSQCDSRKVPLGRSAFISNSNGVFFWGLCDRYVSEGRFQAFQCNGLKFSFSTRFLI